MSGHKKQRIAAVAGVILLAFSAVAVSADWTETPALRDARNEFEVAKRKYERALETEVKRAIRVKDEEAASELNAELDTLRVGFSMSDMVGTWRVDYTNGTTRTYFIAANGTVNFSEEHKSGRYVVKDGRLVLDFGSRPVEVLYLEPALRVLHYNPKTDLGRRPPKVRGVGRKLMD